MTDEAVHLATILDAPDDDAPRLVAVVRDLGSGMAGVMEGMSGTLRPIIDAMANLTEEDRNALLGDSSVPGPRA